LSLPELDGLPQPVAISAMAPTVAAILMA